MVLKHYEVKKYDKSYYDIWNQFVTDSKNGTFLFHRDFMEYHSDRFEDYSLVVFDEKNKLVAILPANRVGSELYSHQGLTYGGIVLTSKVKLTEFIYLFKEVLYFLHSNKISKFVLKEIPSFYCEYFSDEMNYCLFLTNATLLRRDSLSTIDLRRPYKISKTRMENIRRGKSKGLIIKEDNDFDMFWNEILIPNLNNKHSVKPVHTVQEIIYLQSKFRDNIRHFNVYYDDKIVAGTTIFVVNNVIHPQYVSGNFLKNELGSLDFLYHHLITEVFKDKEFFDFGISNEENGRKLNSGLLFWKESFGAKTVAQSFYEVDTSNYVLLNDVLL